MAILFRGRILEFVRKLKDSITAQRLNCAHKGINKFCDYWMKGILLINYTGRFIIYSANTKIYYRKPVGHVFTKPLQIEGTIKKPFLQ
jgi:hypothetical protein